MRRKSRGRRISGKGRKSESRRRRNRRWRRSRRKRRTMTAMTRRRYRRCNSEQAGAEQGRAQPGWS